MPRSPFDAAVPGQSLTKEPKSQRWEQPPQYTKPEQALESIYDNIMTKSRVNQKMLAMLDTGVSLESMARTILMAGFSNGKWTPDMALLMAKPLTTMLAGVAKAAGRGGAKAALVNRREKKEKELQSIFSLSKASEDREQDLPAGFFNKSIATTEE